MGHQSFRRPFAAAHVSSLGIPGQTSAPLMQLDYFHAANGRLGPVELTDHTLFVPLQAERRSVIQRRDGERVELDLAAGLLNVTPSGTVSSWEWSQPMDVVLLRIRPEQVQAFVSGDLRVLASGSKLDGIVMVEDPELTTRARELQRAAAQPGPGQAILFEALARVFLITLLRRYLVTEPAEFREAGGLDPDRYGELVAFIDAHIDRTLRTPDLAHHLGLSESVLTRALKNAAGITPQDLVRQRRIAAVKSLLLRPEISLGEIAIATGFADQAHLSRSFKIATGSTPSAYRKGQE